MPTEDHTERQEREKRGQVAVDGLVKKFGLKGVLDKKEPRVARADDFVAFNIAVCVSWPLFSFFLLSQPWMSNFMNNNLHNYSADYVVYGDNGKPTGSHRRAGLCTTPAQELHCTNGENFTELALKYRGVALGCGCGQGVLGEGLCPMTAYGHTLSDFVSTGPSIAAMLGLGFFPLQGAWRTTEVINKMAQPSPAVARMHSASLMVFQISYIAWGVCSACIFPTSHAVLTVIFLMAYLKHWLMTGLICMAAWGFEALESRLIFAVSMFCIAIMGLGSIPRVFLVLNDALDTDTFPNWNRGVGSYSFWFAEAAGLSATFGVYPMMLIGFCLPSKREFKPIEFSLWYDPKAKDD